MRRELVLVGLILFSLSGCMARLRTFHRGDTVPDGSVLMVGRLVMDPWVQVSIDPLVIDAGGSLGKVVLLFTETPTARFTRAAHADLYATAPQGELLAVVVPRRPLYLRGVYMIDSVHGGLNAYQQETAPRTHEILCATQMTIEPKPEDQVIYIGVIYCHYERSTPEARVYDEWKAIEPQVRSYTDTARVKMRFPTAR